MSQRITIIRPDGSFEAYVARPESGTGPAIVVIQEIFGINADMRAHCDALAEQGYIAVCPDLFWRLQPGVELSDRTEAEWAQAMDLYQRFDVDKGVEDVSATMEEARKLLGSTGKVGIVGFCLGGLLTFLTAARYGGDAAVAYYGGGTDKYVGEMDKLQTPLMMHLAEEDQFISKEARDVIARAAKGRPGVQVHTYPGQNHAFARVNGTHFNLEAARVANERTAQFFAKHLR